MLGEQQDVHLQRVLRLIDGCKWCHRSVQWPWGCRTVCTRSGTRWCPLYQPCCWGLPCTALLLGRACELGAIRLPDVKSLGLRRTRAAPDVFRGHARLALMPWRQPRNRHAVLPWCTRLLVGPMFTCPLTATTHDARHECWWWIFITQPRHVQTTLNMISAPLYR